MGYAQRIERLKDEKAVAVAEYSEAIKEVWAEAKGRGFDMRVLAYDPMPDPAYARANGIELVDLLV